MRLPWTGRGEPRAGQGPAYGYEIGGGGPGYDRWAPKAGEYTPAEPAANASNTAVAAAAELFGMSFARATVEEGERASEVWPVIAYDVGARLIERGSYVAYVTAGDGGEVEVVEASAWRVKGPRRRDAWRYELTLPAPDRSTRLTAPAEAVVHVRWASPRDAPWLGVAPWGRALDATVALTNLERSLRHEYRTPVGTVIFTNSGQGQHAKEQLSRTLGRMAGDTLVAEFGAIGQVGASGATATPSRIGPNPPATVVEAQKQLCEVIWDTIGIPAVLMAPVPMQANSSDAKAWRDRLQGRLDLVSAELGRALDETVHIEAGTLGGPGPVEEAAAELKHAQAEKVAAEAEAERAQADKVSQEWIDYITGDGPLPASYGENP